jgi:hypothetical protein
MPYPAMSYSVGQVPFDRVRKLNLAEVTQGKLL